MGLATFGCMNLFFCPTSWLTDGIWVGECPSGDVVPTLNASVSGLGRGTTGSVNISADGHYTTNDADDDRVTTIRRLDAELALVDATGKETPLETEDGWDGSDGYLWASLRLPQVPDGDYLLRVRGDTAAGEASVDVPLPLYAPARVHLITDRPLYEPGNTVQFRALALRARDLSPLEGRPGTWTVLDPSGLVVLEEKAPSGDWGVVAGSFPLDTGAPSGDWTVRWTSGAETGQAVFRVEPFTLPRFRVEARADRDAWFAGDQPVLRGRVVYSSGAPVSNAGLEIDWRVDGAWPPPTRWTQAGAEGALPVRAQTDRDGAFVLNLPVVPADLQGQARLVARITATDPAGERVAGAAQVLLSQDRIQVQAETELAEGLVEKANNRVYLRATTAAGQVLSRAQLLIKRAWDPTDPGTRVETDSDGVATVQLTPGAPVNIVVPALPYRPPPPPRAVERESARELFVPSQPTLQDLLGLDRWEAKLAPCALWVDEGEEALELVARVTSAGQVRLISDLDSPLRRCAARALAGERLSPDRERLYELRWTLRAPKHPAVEYTLGSPVTSTLSAVEGALTRGALLARACLTVEQEDDGLAQILELEATPGARRVRASWSADPYGGDLSPAVAACVRRAFETELGGDLLDEPWEGPAYLGYARISVSAVSADDDPNAPQDTVMLGYELRVTALGEGDRPIGDTLLRMRPGAVPPVRLRADPVLPRPGDTVNVELLRGPDFSGELPEKLALTSPTFPTLEAKLDPDTRKASFTLPKDAEGWYELSWGGAQTRVFVRPEDELSLSLEPDNDRYAPGQVARITVKTQAGERPVAAGVTLIGVDESLGQLAPLPGADALDPLRPRPDTPSPAFGVLDGAALTMGRVRGENAAAAAVLRVSRIPSPPELDAVVNSQASGSFTPLEPLTDRFYPVLAELYALTRDWEASAPKGELMKPEKMADLWDEALDRVEDAGGAVEDAYGRRLRLGLLPASLLELTDPRQAVLDGTRLPEDVEDWALWVAREKP